MSPDQKDLECMAELEYATIDNICKGIADKIGQRVEDIVREVVELSRKHRIMYHGIKEGKNAEQINLYGLKPLTPMSGPCSFWSTGLALFEPDMDSPFFNYSGGSSRNRFESVCELNMALARYDTLANKGAVMDEYSQDSQVTVHSPIDRQDLTLIKVVVEHPPTDDYKSLRQYRQAAELKLLGRIYAELAKEDEKPMGTYDLRDEYTINMTR
jgi:hypothetical protein